MKKNKTLIERLKAGERPEVIDIVVEEEPLDADELVDELLSGTAVLPKNIKRDISRPCALGQGLRTKVNANIGTSRAAASIEGELEKLRAALDAGADTVMDLSTGGELAEIRRAILENSPVPIGTVPIYEAAVVSQERHESIVEMTPDEMFEAIERHAEDGVDFVTVHCGVTTRALNSLKLQGRIVDIVSRGGAFLAGWILHNDRENPLYEDFDRLLDIAKRHDVTLSLGDGFRPGAVGDATDTPQIQELITIGELVTVCWEAGVQCMVEGPGHVPIHQVVENVRLAKDICRGAPFYVLGPLVTDVAAGYDHIVGAIGGTLAGAEGADFLCYVTPREHLGLPEAEDVREGVVVTRIAAHAADLAKNPDFFMEWDNRMSRARKSLKWGKQIELALDPRRAGEIFSQCGVEEDAGCTMCGDLCAMEFIAHYLDSGKSSC